MVKENRFNDIGSKVSWTFLLFSTTIFLILTGVNFISGIPSHGQYIYALSMMGTSVYFTMKILEVWGFI